MPPKQKTGKKVRASKNITVIHGVSTADMTKDEIEAFVILLREELEKEKNERNLTFLEKDAVARFWDLTKKQLEDTRALLTKKEREIEDADERHQLEMKVYKQKLKHLMFEQNSREAEAKKESLQKLSSANEESRTEIRAIRNENFTLKAKLRQQQVQSEESIKQLRRQHELDMAHIRQEFSRQTEEIENRSAKQMAMLREQVDTQRRVEVHNTEERKNSHIQQLEANHERAFANMKAYYNDITLGNVSVIKTLRENIDDLRLQLARVQNLLDTSQGELEIKNQQFTSMEKELNHLRHIAKLFENEKIAHRLTKNNAKKRLAEQQKLQMDYDIMQARFEALDKQRGTMAKQFENLLLEAQQRLGLRALLVERKLTSLAKILEAREAQVSQLIVALESDPRAIKLAKEHLEKLLKTKNSAIEELQYEVMRMGKAYNELWSACQRKLNDEMNNPLNLGIKPVKVNINLTSPFNPATALGCKIVTTDEPADEDDEVNEKPDMASDQLGIPRSKVLPLGQGPTGLASVAPF